MGTAGAPLGPYRCGMLSILHERPGAVCGAVALALTALAVGCAIAGLRRRPRSWSGVAAAAIMSVGSLDMVVAGVRLMHPIAWGALMLFATLALLIVPGDRGDRALHAGGMLLMAAMWATTAGPSNVAGGVVGAASGAVGHGSHGGFPLTWAVLVAAVALALLAARRALHRADAGCGRVRGWSRWGHPLMAAGTACMALAMPLG